MTTLPMTQVMTSTTMTRTRADGVQKDVTVNFGVPSLNPNALVGSFPYFYCPIQLVNFQDDTVYPINGVDSTDALINALCFAGRLLAMSLYADEFGELTSANNYGFPNRTVVPHGSTISGTVQLELCNDAAQNITFEFRPGNGNPPTVIHQILTPLAPGGDTGSFSIPGVPDGTYDLAIKGFCWLRKVVPIVVAGADVSGLNVFLLGGDINNDNFVDATDFAGFVSDFGQQGDP